MKMIYGSNGLDFSSKNIEDALLKNECLSAFDAEEGKRSYEVEIIGRPQTKYKTYSKLSWHELVTRLSVPTLTELPAVKALAEWGMDVDSNSIKKVEEVLAAKQKEYYFNRQTIEEVKRTERYKKALEQVEKAHGGALKDGSFLFDYQKEGAALMSANERLLLAYDMGLGKTRTTIAGLTSDPRNKKILIITMSRNINDWVKECHVMGLEDEYIILQNPTDLHSDKRIHLVSYEKWAGDRVTYAPKLHESCPTCGAQKLWWNNRLQYCKRCGKAEPLMEDDKQIRYSSKDFPKVCPHCHTDWKKWKLHCNCGFSLVEKKIKGLSSYYHHGYDACGVDEVQFIKNGDSKRSKAVRKVKTRVKVAISGTPAENGSEDLYWLIGWLTGFSSRFEDPYFLEPFKGYGKLGEEHFRMFFGGGAKKRVLDTDKIESRVSNHYQLWDLLDTLMIRKKKTDEEVKDSIKVPKPKHIRQHLTMNESDRKLYEDILEEFRNWYELELAKKEAAEARGDTYRISTIIICSWMDKLRKAASCPWTFPEYDPTLSGGESTKIAFLKAKAKLLLRQGKKFLVFTAHKRTAEELGILLDGIIPGKTAGYIHGGVEMKYRFEMMDRFQNPNDNLAVLVLTTKTGAESYTLTEAKAVFLFDLDFNGKKIEQCYSRAVRLGQREIVEIYWLLAIDTIDINMRATRSYKPCA